MPFLALFSWARNIAIAAAFSAVVLLIAALGITSKRLDRAKLEAAAATASAQVSERNRAAEAEHHARTTSALQQRAEAAEALNAKHTAIRQEIANAPRSQTCSTSPAIRRLLDGVQSRPAGSPQRRPAAQGNPRKPDGVSARTSATR